MPPLKNTCPECGAVWQEGQTCQDHFYQMLAWEHENPANLAVHHLMVLCYHLQHPSLYSPEGLRGAIHLLDDFVGRGLTPEQTRKRDRPIMNSHERTWKIKGTPASHGVYDRSVQWTMTAANVIENGIDNYCDSVQAWARSMYDVLKSVGILRAHTCNRTRTSSITTSTISLIAPQLSPVKPPMFFVIYRPIKRAARVPIIQAMRPVK